MQTSRPKPQSINPVEWAEYNAERPPLWPGSHMLGDARPIVIMTDEREAELAEAIRRYDANPPALVAITSEAPAARILEEAINRAVADLEGQGSRSDRVALQLLTALALYAAEVGK